VGGLKTLLYKHKRHHGAWLGISMPPRIVTQGLDEELQKLQFLMNVLSIGLPSTLQHCSRQSTFSFITEEGSASR
jgi:hypothetical protein